MGCELAVNAASFGMNIFKYMMRILHTRVKEEWQDFDVAYPQWLRTLVMDELYYVTTLVVTCIACFAMGMITGIVWTMV
jgi:hypothetical protein